MQVARFEILGILGTGAYGVVALARDRADASSEPVALKVLNLLADARMMGRLRREASVLAWLSHPNIVQVHRLLEKDGRPVVVMDYVRGASVTEQIHRLRGPLPEEVAFEVARHCALALEAAYDTPGPDGVPMRIVHRDIKAANLLISLEGEVKVVDFGIASQSFDVPGGQVLGTRGYAAPERWTGAVDTPAVDVYSLGVTLFEMLTGKRMNQTMVADKHDASVGMMLDHLRRGKAEEARALIGRMCRFDASERPTFRVVVEALEEMTPEDVDLRAYADYWVRPLHTARLAAVKENDQAWSDVAFLEASGPVHDRAVATSGPVRGLALRAETELDVESMLAAILPQPWWSFHAADPASVVAGLLALRGTRDPRVLARAQELTEHADASIVDAAWDVLISAA